MKFLNYLFSAPLKAEEFTLKNDTKGLKAYFYYIPLEIMHIICFTLLFFIKVCIVLFVSLIANICALGIEYFDYMLFQFKLIKAILKQK